MADLIENALRRLLPEKLYMRFTRIERRLTLSLPLAKVALALGRLRLRSKSGPRGVDRLDAIVVVNLAERPDRLEDFEREMRRLGVTEYTRFEAIRGTPGILGCTRSHAECMRQIIERSYGCTMICEDDARFLVSREELDVLIDAFLDDPRTDVALLAYHHLGRPTAHSPLFARAPYDTRTTACYLVKSSIAKTLQDVFQEGARQLEAGGDRLLYGLDAAWAPLQKSHVFVIPIKRAVHQADGYSDIEETFVSYGGL
jgi:GR25 family glycosyltransferase involved in LPS biosynthesis